MKRMEGVRNSVEVLERELNTNDSPFRNEMIAHYHRVTPLYQKFYEDERDEWVSRYAALVFVREMFEKKVVK